MTDRGPKEEKLTKLLRRLSQKAPEEGFDKRFWEKFELEKNIPLAHKPLGARLVSKPVLYISAAAVFITALFLISSPLDHPSVNILNGKATLTDATFRTKSLRPKDRLKAGDHIKTDKAGWLIVELDKGYRIKINPDSEIAVDSLKRSFLPGKTVLKLSKGDVLVSIGDQAPRKYPLEIRTPNAFAKAMGTQFAVSASSVKGSESRVSVLKGVVEVGPLAGNVPATNVSPGQEIFIAADSLLRPQAMVDKSRRELEEFFQFSKKDRAILLISMGPGRVRELLRPCAIYLRFESRSQAALEIEAISRNIQLAMGEADPKEHLAAVQRLERAVDREMELEKPPVLLFVGAYYAYLGKYEDAVRIFEKTAFKYSDSHLSSLALKAAAILYEEKMDLPDKAAVIRLKILKDYPESYEAS